MSNSHIKLMMLGVLDDYAAGLLTPTDVESRIGHMIHAIECIDSKTIDASRTLSARLVRAWGADGALVPCIGDEPISVVVAAFRTFVQQLPD